MSPRPSRKKVKNTAPPPDQQPPLTIIMDLITTGMHVDIKRSDGRVHTAVVTETKRDRNVVMVEWFEKSETKGKEIDLDQLLECNPTLRRRPQQHVFDTSVFLGNDENEETLDDIQLPPSIRPKFRPDESAKNRKTMLFNTPPAPTARAPAPQLTQPTVPTKIVAPAAPAPRTSIVAPRKSLMPPPTKISQSAAATPVTAAVNVMTKSADKIDLNETKDVTLQNVEKLQKDREERRAQQELIKKAREMEKAIDPGNPAYQFLLMIRDYQSNIDYRPLKMSDLVADNRISVCVRKRPLNKKEIAKKEIEVITIPNRDHLVLHQPQTKVDLTKYLDNQKFRFDFTFDENSTNEMVYKFTAQPLVKTVFEQGFATCFAYGQTGSGKTHTMGGDFSSGKNQNVGGGIYALTTSDVFRLRNKDYKKHNLAVFCSFFELYGNKVFDLLNSKQLLRVLEDGKKEVNVVGLKEVLVESESDVLDLIRKGTEMRTAGATSANSNSSRSHAIFQIVLKKKEKLWGKFSLIDLAGNERGQDTGNSDQQTRMEGAEINKSLLALKECIRSMARNSNHIPFRSSKLTLVLRDSFIGENARTCMIAMISPGMSSCEHTLNTLRYADRVKELGADEGGSAAVMADNEFMKPKVNSDDEEEDEEEEDLSLICSANNTNAKEFEDMKAISRVSAAEDQVLAKQLEIPAALHLAAEYFQKSVVKVSDPDLDQKKYARDLINYINKTMHTLESFKVDSEQWLSLIQKEAELSAKNQTGIRKK